MEISSGILKTQAEDVSLQTWWPIFLAHSVCVNVDYFMISYYLSSANVRWATFILYGESSGQFMLDGTSGWVPFSALMLLTQWLEGHMVC